MISEIVQQYNDGLITDAEALMKLVACGDTHPLVNVLSAVAGIALTMHKQLAQKYWYRLERLDTRGYEKVKGSMTILADQKLADTLNRSCLEGYRWHSTLAATEGG